MPPPTAGSPVTPHQQTSERWKHHRGGSTGRPVPASPAQSLRRTPWKRAASPAAPPAEAGRRAAAARVFNTSAVSRTNAPARRKAVLFVCVPEQCRRMTWVLAAEENVGTQEIDLEREVSRTTCPASAGGLNAVKLQGQPVKESSSFKHKHLLHSKLLFFSSLLAYSSNLWVFSTIQDDNRCLGKLIALMFKP